ncbi:alpha-amylase family glycosyl hydrolase [Olivibacter sitiensis]|uniref:alpha-amylase family glycosyl hydrolase n=1 Tax=Olivibacter sitiensis TaxID=376470 RepID=UPI0003FB7F21|nr:alpha-amylase family glycosyl hydrolase [Olivibacter sitiensis]
MKKFYFLLATYCFLLLGSACKKTPNPDIDRGEQEVTFAGYGVRFADGGHTTIFALRAPGKQSVRVIGDFNGWGQEAGGDMGWDEESQAWLAKVEGLDAGQTYAYQYLVNGQQRIADPYAELILDPDNDPYISNEVFPDLMTYPTGKTTGLVAVAQYGGDGYSWQQTSFQRPHKHDLVIYELLVRDFVAAHDYHTLIDTLDYLQRLGVNAIELLPVNEFEGNLSWGYNPSYMFAVDKYYGTKRALKAFVDACHARGMAVIHDVVLNHAFGQSAMVQLYFANGRPSNGSPWFNMTPMHPFNVGYDFNHESAATKAYVKDVVKYWMEEFKLDGFRFDLSKGFTQVNSGTSDSGVEQWGAYDASRIAIWKEYNDYMKSIDPTFYVILEHFAEDTEEKELAAQGMMLWNNINHAFNEATMGWVNNGGSDISRLYHQSHGFDAPDLISYMESHDEERLMFKNGQYGNAVGGYDVKQLEVGLKRVEAAAAFLYTAPGPKMLWQFGELGYDISIDENGRTGNKPILWQYAEQPARKTLYSKMAKLIRLKTKNAIFRDGIATPQVRDGVKYVRVTKGEEEIYVMGNFDVVAHELSIPEFEAGQWYDAMTGERKNWPATFQQQLAPGQYYILSKTLLNE